MSNVLSFFGFSKALIENEIVFSLRDFLDVDKVDILIQKLVDKTCNTQTFLGCGISRSCFSNSDSYAIKVDKTIYVDANDDYAAEDYNECTLEEDYEDFGWAYDNLEDATSPSLREHDYSQCQEEISVYKDILKNNSHLLNKVAKIYAYSSNQLVEVVEYCSEVGHHYEACRDLEKLFDDIHANNVGLNKQGKAVAIDFGYCF